MPALKSSTRPVASKAVKSIAPAKSFSAVHVAKGAVNVWVAIVGGMFAFLILMSVASGAFAQTTPSSSPSSSSFSQIMAELKAMGDRVTRMESTVNSIASQCQVGSASQCANVQINDECSARCQEIGQRMALTGDTSFNVQQCIADCRK